MAGLLGKLGVVAVFADFVSQHLVVLIGSGHPSLSLQRLFTLNISLPVVQLILRRYSLPLQLFGSDGRTNSIYHLALWFDEQPYCTLTHYSSGVTPIFFGAGYVPQGTWWRVGLLFLHGKLLNSLLGWYPWHVAIRYSIIFKNPSTAVGIFY